MEPTTKTFLTELKEQLIEYVGIQQTLTKLTIYEKVSLITAALSWTLVLLFLASFTFLFLFIALGLFLGTVLNSSALGFTLVAGFYLVLIAIGVILRKKIQRFIVTKMIILLTQNDLEDDEQPEPTV